MDSRWYLFPGQSMENTASSDRVRALYMTRSSWNKITKHLDRKKLLLEAAAKEAAVKKYLDEGSKNMTKNWENSLENVRKKKKEEKLRLMEQKKEERHQKFLELKMSQEEIRTKYIKKVQKQIFMNTGNAKNLTSALVTSEILFERQKQKEFKEKLQRRDKEEDLSYLEFQKKKAEEQAKTEEQKKNELMIKDKKYGEELKKSIVQKETLNKFLKEEKIKKEAMDNIEAAKEIKKIENFELNEKLRKMREWKKETEKSRIKKKEMEMAKLKEEKELDEVIEIYQQAKHRIDCLKKQKTMEMRDAVLKRREKITAMVMAEQETRFEGEELAIKKALIEKEAAELEKLKTRQKFDEKIKQECLRNHEEMFQRQKEKMKTEMEVKKWELLNRYKTTEELKKYEENKRLKKWQDILEYRKDLCEQIEDRKQEEQREKQIEEAMANASIRADDMHFFDYADEVLSLAKSKGRSTIPIERVIKKYMLDMNVSSDKYPHLANLCKGSVNNTSELKPCRCEKEPVKV
ncbi:hypothetical protein ABEB36_008355 [Hypothenemus hampei]|uniref:Trichohyalin-plectin-homology domain-containing protein n=1 Tax=Hypothenemus hampei TaxID=57062 RepID=A0ABD1ELJ3_HYPHA